MGVFNLLKFSSEENMAKFRKDVSLGARRVVGVLGIFCLVFQNIVFFEMTGIVL